VRVKPEWAEAYNNLGFALGSMNRWPEAIEAHKRAVQLKPDYAGAIFNLGFDYYQSGDSNRAMEQYKILEKMNPNMAAKLYIIINKRNPPAQRAY
jgi:tetratricopeptide (TPR) repeat protein